MKYITKSFFLLYIILTFSLKGNVNYNQLLILLLIIAVNVFGERFNYSIYVIMVSYVFVFIAVLYDKNFGVLLSLVLLDFVYKKAYWGIALIFTAVFFLPYTNIPSVLLTSSICAVLAYVMEKSEKKEIKFTENLDAERRLRYELEQVKVKLTNSTNETVRLAEISERNRIAREIHDNVGHSIAGILIQLQASYKLYDIDNEKSKTILNKSIAGLSNTVTLLRDTVHNIKPLEITGLDYIRRIITEFEFCEIDFNFTGDFSTLHSNNIAVLSSNIKEALTNSAKHSNATKVEIILDINEKFIRLFIKDNGNGCKTVTEGLGLSGMKERIANMGGNISISGTDGFMIVCIIPLKEVSIFESTNS